MSRVRMAREGGADYLEFGIRKDSEYTRKEKDNVISLYGSIQHIRNAEQYCMECKDWKYNYETIVVAFDVNDMAILERLSENERNEKYRNICMSYLKHRTSGYDLMNEIIAYGECHEPKIKFENGKVRQTHLHIQISYLNPMNNTQIKTTYYNNAYMSDVLDKCVAKENGLTYIKETNENRKKPKAIQKTIDESKILSFRKQLIKDLQYCSSKKEFEDYCKKNKLEIVIKKTFDKKGKEKNNYIKIIKEDKSTLNLRQFEFNHLKKFYDIKESKPKKNMIDEINAKSAKDLRSELNDYYKQRIEMIDKRRSKDYKKELNKIIDEDLKSDKNINNETVKSLKNLSFQEKIFYKTYQKDIKDFDFKGYYIDSKDVTTKFTNNQKQIKIEDKGNEIVSNSKSDSLEEEVSLMLKIAEAKGWNIANLDVTGNDDFKAEVEKQIANRLKEIQKYQKKEVPQVPDFQKERPNSELQNYKKDFVEKQYQKEANTNQDLQKIKTELQAKKVLDFAIQKYKINPKDFKITDDNKIDNLKNKQKPKNVIDFLQKEANLSTKEAIEICQDLYKNENKNTHKKEVEKVQEVQKSEEVKKREKERGGRER